MSNNQVYVIGLPQDVTNDIVRQYFNAFGTIETVDIGFDDSSGTTAVVRFEDAGTIALVLAVNDHKIMENSITVVTSDMILKDPSDQPQEAPDNVPVKTTKPNIDKELNELAKLTEELKNKRKSAEIEDKRLNAKKM